jgi:SAM-dependent methyltransferase
MSILELAHHLAADEHGIWTGPDHPLLWYPVDGNQECFQVEDASFWFKHRNNCILAIIRHFPPAGPVLDVGGGNGCVTRAILDAGFEAALLEPGAIGVLNAKTKRHIPEVMCCRLEDAGFPPSSLSAIGVFDVLEHLGDDSRFTEQIQSLLKPGGMLYGTVPAYHWLWSLDDAKAEHFRRYNRRMVSRLLSGRFDVLYCGYFFAALVLPVLFLRAIPFRLGPANQKGLLVSGQEHGVNGGISVHVLNKLLANEPDVIASGKEIVVGTSCLFVARRRIA